MIKNLQSALPSLRAHQDKLVTFGICAAALVLARILGKSPSRLVLGAMAALLGGAFLLRFPEMRLPLLVLAAFVLPIEFQASDFVSVNGVILMLPLLAALWLVDGLRTHDLRLRHSPTTLPLLALVGAASLSWLWGNLNWDPAFPRSGNLLFVQLGEWAMYALSVVAYLLAAQQSVKSLKWSTFAYLGLGAAALLGKYGGPAGNVLFGSVSRYATTNGGFFVWLTALAGGQALFNEELGRQRRNALFILALLVPILGFLMASDWASSWLPSVGVILVLLWLRSRLAGTTSAFLLLVAVVAFSGLLLQQYNWEVEREVSVGGRYLLWESIFRLALRQPILGLGLTTYRQYHLFIPLLTLGGGQWFTPSVNSHNLYLDLFAQLGIVGLAVFLWGMIAIGRLGWRLRQEHSKGFRAGYVNGALAGLIGMLLASVIVEWLIPFVYNVGFPGFRFSALSWVFLGGLVALDSAKDG